MGDPLSIAASAAGLISLGLTVCSGITSYLDAVRSRAEDVDAARRQADGIRNMLFIVDESIEKLNYIHTASVDAARACLQTCTIEVKALDLLVDEIGKTTLPATTIRLKIKEQKKRFTYAFKKEELERLEQHLARVHSTLQGALQVLGLNATSRILDTVSSIDAKAQSNSAQLPLIQSTIASLQAPMSMTATQVTQIQETVRGLEPSMSVLGQNISAEVSHTREGMDERIADASAQHFGHMLESKEHVLREISKGTEETLHGVSSGTSEILSKVDDVHTQVQQVSIGNGYIAQELREFSHTQQETNSMLLARVSRMERLLHDHLPTANNSTQALKQLMGKPATLQRVSDGLNREAPGPGLLFPINKGQSLSAACSCRTRRSFSRRTNTKGNWSVFWESDTLENHREDCEFAMVNCPQETRRLGLRFLGLRRLINTAIGISFTLTTGAGGSGISPLFDYYPSVDENTAPAFRLLNLAYNCVNQHMWRITSRQRAERDLELVVLCLKEIPKLYFTKKASPRDIDSNGRSIMHLIFSLLFTLEQAMHRFHAQYIDILSVDIVYIVDALVKLGVPTMSCDNSGRTPIDEVIVDSIKFLSNYPTLGKSVNAIMSTESTTSSWSSPEGLFCDVHQFPTLFKWSCPPHVLTEIFDFGPLSLAAYYGDVQRVEYLLRHYPRIIGERNAFGHTPLHMAIRQPQCLQLLVDAADENVFCKGDNNSHTPLYATMQCCARAQCQNESLRILLDSGCSIVMEQIGGNSCLDCKSQYYTHYKQRRKDLREFALKNLPGKEARALGLFQSAVLDTGAREVVEALSRHGISIPNGLQAIHDHCNNSNVVITSVFHCHPLKHWKQSLQMLWDLGFRDVNSIDNQGQTPLFSHIYHSDLDLSQSELMDVIIWFLNHSADLWSPLSDLGTRHSEIYNSAVTTAHHISQSLGLEWWSLTHPLRLKSRKWDYGEPCKDLHNQLLSVGVQDDCRCECSTGGCTPLTTFLKGIISDGCRDKQGEFQEILEYLVSYIQHVKISLTTDHCLAIIRFLTFHGLEMRHTCCDFASLDRNGHSLEEILEIQEEDQPLQDILEELLSEFGDKFATEVSDEEPFSLHSTKVFWTGYWLRRMLEVRASLSGNSIGTAARQAAEDVGVEWYDGCGEGYSDESSEYDSEDPVTKEYWKYKPYEHWLGEAMKIISTE